jgi:hypothetical protein
MVHVVSSQRSHGDKAEDGWVDVMGYIILFYPNFIIFFVLGHKGNLVIRFSTNRASRAVGEVIIQPSLSHPLTIVAF